jgi:hypothetical protein
MAGILGMQAMLNLADRLRFHRLIPMQRKNWPKKLRRSEIDSVGGVGGGRERPSQRGMEGLLPLGDERSRGDSDASGIRRANRFGFRRAPLLAPQARIDQPLNAQRLRRPSRADPECPDDYDAAVRVASRILTAKLTAKPMD